MRRQTQLIIDCSNRKPLDLRTVAPVHTDNFWIMRNLQSEFGHTGRMLWIGLGCTCIREMTLIARANGEDQDQPVHSIHPSLHNVFMIDFVYLIR